MDETAENTADSDGAGSGEPSENVTTEAEPILLGAKSFRTLNCYQCLMQFEDAYYCSTADQIQFAEKESNSAYDYGFCCGGGPVGENASSMALSHWK